MKIFAIHTFTQEWFLQWSLRYPVSVMITGFFMSHSHVMHFAILRQTMFKFYLSLVAVLMQIFQFIYYSTEEFMQIHRSMKSIRAQNTLKFNNSYEIRHNNEMHSMYSMLRSCRHIQFCQMICSVDALLKHTLTNTIVLLQSVFAYQGEFDARDVVSWAKRLNKQPVEWVCVSEYIGNAEWN